MTLIITPLAHASRLFAERGPSHVLTLLSPESEIPTYDGLAPGHHLTLRFNDIVTPMEGLITPSRPLIDDLLAFGAAWTGQKPFLIHCWAGVSRSTAAAFILCCRAGMPGQEQDIATRLRAAAPFATPNRLMVALADASLDRQGAMIAAIDAIGRGVDCSEGSPFEMVMRDNA